MLALMSRKAHTSDERVSIVEGSWPMKQFSAAVSRPKTLIIVLLPSLAFFTSINCTAVSQVPLLPFASVVALRIWMLRADQGLRKAVLAVLTRRNYPISPIRRIL